MMYKDLVKVKDEIIQKYEIEKKSAAEIAEIFCLKKSAYARILRILKENNIKIRDFGDTRPRGKHKVNDDYFKYIDSEEKAYWLGFLYADGSIIYRNGAPTKIVLALKDEQPITDFAKAIESSHKICQYDIFDKRTNKSYRRNSISVTSKHFAVNLCNQGLKGKSNWGTAFPNIKDEYFSSFLRGLFDGDGTISKDKNNRFTIGFIAPGKIMDYIQNKLINILDIRKNVKHIKYINNSGELNYLYCYNYKDINNILDFIYKKSTISTRLGRKYDRYLEFKQNYIE